MRTFIAIEVSDEIKKILGQIESHLKYSGADVKWVRPEIIHVTMKFLGEVSETKVSEVKSALDAVAASTKKFDITLKDIGAFPKIDYPRVIWVGLGKGVGEALELASSIDEALSKIGFAKEDRPFSPHLTIGRVRSSVNRSKLKEKMASVEANFNLSAVPSHRVESVVLFQSTLTSQGSIYTKLHESYLQA
ncbi:MAG: RNA 2',3'-cyclic phosphodiesterase [Candidatus Omnitrophica bacterium]|nr:RNA 2',3'-cyclic phosphodiesterase [Candidatus Omnitrophota bacterium]